MRHRKSFCMLLATILLAAPALPASATGGQPSPPGAEESGHRRNQRSGAQILGAVPEPSSETLDRIRQEGEAVLTGTHWSYDPAGRRDPFRSLVEEVAIKGEGERPKGIAGMMISEVDLVGIITSPKGEIAFLNGSDNKGYFMRSGDSLYDGTVVDIDRAAGRVIFRQRVDDPREIKPYREIVKKLYSSTEDGQ